MDFLAEKETNEIFTLKVRTACLARPSPSAAPLVLSLFHRGRRDEG